MSTDSKMNSLFTSVQCLQCGHEMEADLFLRMCERCESPWLSARYRLDALPSDWSEQVRYRPTTLWRYEELLPYQEEGIPLSLGEGWTPMTRALALEKDFEHEGIWIKDERQQPTGSFKDRQAALTVSALRARGVDEVALASTGNAAVAYAAFCARAGIKLWVFLTSSVPAEKMRELALYGAEVVKVTGTYDQAKAVAANFAERRGIYYDLGAKGLPGKESMKSVAFEIVEQLGWRAPDWYVQAVSGGIGPLGVLKGFIELYEAGIIDRVPKLGIVQVEGCAPMVRAWEQGQMEATPVQPDTLITVLATGDPGMSYKLLKEAYDQFGGAMVAVDDGDSFRAMRRLARTEGISAEPAASVAFAGLETLLQAHIEPHESIVVNCSGHTFSAEKHALEDRYVLHLEMETAPAKPQPNAEGLAAALEQLDEQVTTIVIIDDNPHDSRLIRRLLQSYKNYRIFEAHNGPDGIALARQRQPDLIVLDLTLPEMDGFSIINELKSDERTRHIPVTVISAKSLTPGERDELQRKANSIWQKGNFSTHELLEHVVTTLGGELEQPHKAITTTVQKLADGVSDALNWATSGQGYLPRILVVDDNELDARLLRRLFESRDRFQVVEAHSPETAREYLTSETPDLIILDLLFPDGSGEDLLEFLRNNEETRNVPVVIVSAKSMEPFHRNQLAQQADSIWDKGIMDRNSLLAHVENMLSE